LASKPPRASAASPTIITGIGELLTIPPTATPRRFDQLSAVGLVREAAVAFSGERVLAAGPEDDVLKSIARLPGVTEIKAGGRVVSPGLIDPHSHPIYAGNRAAEFEARILGKTYQEIAALGGGIRATVRHTREASPERLAAESARRLLRMLAHGTTTAEAKSGYGLSAESELAQLRAIRELDRSLPLDLVPTFLGAHEIPDDYRNRRQEYIDLLVHELLPAVAGERLAEFSDVFCERGVYTVDETRHIQQAARQAGLRLKLHADELESTGGAELACELGATSADHLIRVSEAGLRALAQSDTLAVLLPGTSFSLGARHFAPGRDMVNRGLAVALATDCNAGSCNCESLTMAAALAAQYYGFTAAESWCCMTANAAWAVGRQADVGSLSPGYRADIVIWEMEDYRELPYHFGVNLAHRVIKNGIEVARDGVVR
jgi:imidazolonepropionase